MLNILSTTLINVLPQSRLTFYPLFNQRLSVDPLELKRNLLL